MNLQLTSLTQIPLKTKNILNQINQFDKGLTGFERRINRFVNPDQLDPV